MKLQTDPDVVATLAEARKEENWRFRTFLKGLDLEVEDLEFWRGHNAHRSLK